MTASTKEAQKKSKKQVKKKVMVVPNETTVRIVDNSLDFSAKYKPSEGWDNTTFQFHAHKSGTYRIYGHNSKRSFSFSTIELEKGKKTLFKVALKRKKNSNKVSVVEIHPGLIGTSEITLQDLKGNRPMVKKALQPTVITNAKSQTLMFWSWTTRKIQVRETKTTKAGCFSLYTMHLHKNVLPRTFTFCGDNVYVAGRPVRWENTELSIIRLVLKSQD